MKGWCVAIYKVLIADDENKVSLLIRSIIDWERLGLELIGTADNGLSALEIVMQQSPHIVITDVRMPQMDGLEMIAAARKHGSRAKFIVISGYQQFEYAKSALKYGVEDYLLKPISEAELNATLRTAVDKLDSLDAQITREQQSAKDAEKGRSIIHDQLMQRLRDGHVTLADVNREGGLAFDDGMYQAVAVRLDTTRGYLADPQQNRLALGWILRRIVKDCKALTQEHLTTLAERSVVLLCNYHPNQSDELHDFVDNLIVPLKEYAAGFGCYEVTVGISPPVCGFAQASMAVQLALRCLDARLVLGTGRRIDYRVLSSHPDTSPDKSEQLATALEQAITNLDRDAYHQSISSFMERLRASSEHDPTIMYQTACGIVRRTYDMLPCEATRELQDERDRMLDIIEGSSCFAHLMCDMCTVVADRIDILRTTQQDAAGKPVKLAKSYIQEHYAERISLEDIAEIVNLNPVYFSSVFKKSTGENVTDYIVKVRLEEAKRRLRTTNETIAAVADFVGYKDAKYFSGLFAKQVGVKPAQYRKLYS